MKHLHKRTANTAKTIEAYKCECNTCPSCTVSYACGTCLNSTLSNEQFMEQAPQLKAVFSTVKDANTVSISNSVK